MFFTPRYVKEARQFCEAARRVIRYRLDLLTPKQIAEIDERIADLDRAARERNREAVKSRTADLERTVGKIAPPRSNSGWRENCEVLLVAIVIAAGVRAYLLEPFKIPTGSMQPTLNGVVGHSILDQQSPNFIVKAFDFVVRGRTFINVTAVADDAVVRLQEKSKLNYFTWTDVICASGRTYTIFAPRDVVERDFQVRGVDNRYGSPPTTLVANQPIARGYVDNGDFVLVNKVAYNFSFPKRGDVFVFRTTGIERIEVGIPEGLGSQHYIKRLAGIPGDTLRIDQPKLFINGALASERGFQRVMSGEGDYDGYSNPNPLSGAEYLTGPDATFTVPAKRYFALGDNSFHSSDSRYWGTLPEQNITGKAFVAFWPFTGHWGIID